MSGPKKPNNKTKAKGCDILHITTKLINTLYALAVESRDHNNHVHIPQGTCIHASARDITITLRNP